MATDHNFRIKNGLEVGGQLIVNSSGQLVVADIVANQKFHDNNQTYFPKIANTYPIISLVLL